MSRRVLGWALMMSAGVVLSGCGSDGDRPPWQPPTIGARFVTDELPAGITVSLQESSVDADVVVLDIVQQGAGPVYGLAFRLQTEGETLGLASLLPGDPFVGGVTRAVEPETGLTVGVVTQRGDAPGIDTAVIGTVTFDRKSSAGARVTFVPTRSRLFDDRGQSIADVTFVGGELVR